MLAFVGVLLTERPDLIGKSLDGVTLEVVDKQGRAAVPDEMLNELALARGQRPRGRPARATLPRVNHAGLTACHTPAFLVAHCLQKQAVLPQTPCVGNIERRGVRIAADRTFRLCVIRRMKESKPRALHGIRHGHSAGVDSIKAMSTTDGGFPREMSDAEVPHGRSPERPVSRASGHASAGALVIFSGCPPVC